MFRRILTGISTAGMLLLSSIGCSDVDAFGPSEGGHVLRMVCETTFPPYCYRTASGEIDGVEVAIMSVVAECLGRELQVREMLFERFFPSLEAGQADVAASGIAVTKERSNRMLFSDPYMAGAQMLLVSKDSPIRALHELKGRRVGAEHCTTGEQSALQAGCQTIGYTNNLLSMQALLAGEIEAVVTDRRPAELFVRDHDVLRICDEPVLVENYAFAFAGKERRLRDQVNAILRAMHATGVQQQIIARYEASLIGVTVDSLQKVTVDSKAVAKMLMRDRQLRETLEQMDANGQN